MIKTSEVVGKTNKEYKLIKEEIEIPSDATIKKFQDFGDIMSQHQKLVKGNKKTIYRDPKFFLFLLIIVLIAYLLSEVF